MERVAVGTERTEAQRDARLDIVAAQALSRWKRAKGVSSAFAELSHELRHPAAFVAARARSSCQVLSPGRGEQQENERRQPHRTSEKLQHESK